MLHLLRAYGEEQELFDEILTGPPPTLDRDRFLLRRGREYLAVEVKSQDRFAMSMAAGLRAIGELPGVVAGCSSIAARVAKTEDGIEWPFERFDATVPRPALP